MSFLFIRSSVKHTWCSLKKRVVCKRRPWKLVAIKDRLQIWKNKKLECYLLLRKNRIKPKSVHQEKNKLRESVSLGIVSGKKNIEKKKF